MKDVSAISPEYIRGSFIHALKNGYIHAFFQPVYRTITGKICSVEALARWIDPDCGMIAPMELIYELEKAELIYELDMEILRQTCAFYNELKERGTPIHSFSVNLSRHDFNQSDLFERITGILKEYGVSSEAINLEITESDMLSDENTFHRLFNQFTEAGFSFWIDDFGSGYSSLNMLKNYNFDVLKLDLVFLRDFSLKNRQILAPIIYMSKNLGIHTIAEGVETEEQRKFLSSVGCEALQGFLFSRPLTRVQLLEYIDKDPSIIEPGSHKEYWNTAGYLNFQSPTPLESFNEDPVSESIVESSQIRESPVALIEVANEQANYVYTSDEYMRRVYELGYHSLEELESAFNDRISDQYLMMRRLVQNAIGSDTVQELDYIYNDVYFTIKARCLAKLPDKALLALQLRIFETENKTKTSDDMMRYGNALFATYELVTIISPKKDSSERIFSRMGIQSYAKTTGLKDSFRAFCQNEIVREDQDRYMAFCDLDSLEKRVSKEGFIQSFFRLKSTREWKSVRISRIPSDVEVSYLYTIQSVLKEENRRMHIYAKDHSEL